MNTEKDLQFQDGRLDWGQQGPSSGALPTHSGGGVMRMTRPMMVMVPATMTQGPPAPQGMARMPPGAYPVMTPQGMIAAARGPPGAPPPNYGQPLAMAHMIPQQSLGQGPLPPPPGNRMAMGAYPGNPPLMGQPMMAIPMSPYPIPGLMSMHTPIHGTALPTTARYIGAPTQDPMAQIPQPPPRSTAGDDDEDAMDDVSVASISIITAFFFVVPSLVQCCGEARMGLEALVFFIW